MNYTTILLSAIIAVALAINTEIILRCLHRRRLKKLFEAFNYLENLSEDERAARINSLIGQETQIKFLPQGLRIIRGGANLSLIVNGENHDNGNIFFRIMIGRRRLSNYGTNLRLGRCSGLFLIWKKKGLLFDWIRERKITRASHKLLPLIVPEIG